MVTRTHALVGVLQQDELDMKGPDEQVVEIKTFKELVSVFLSVLLVQWTMDDVWVLWANTKLASDTRLESFLPGMASTFTLHEPKLFQAQNHPQHLQTCILPDPTMASSRSRSGRRFGETIAKKSRPR